MSKTTTTSHYCEFIKPNGQQCRAYARTDSAYCTFHDPAFASERAKAHSAGGRARHGRKIGSAQQPGEPITLATVADVVKLLESEVNAVLTLEISLSRGQTISRLALAFIKAFEVSELQLRLEALERALQQRERDNDTKW